VPLAGELYQRQQQRCRIGRLQRAPQSHPYLDPGLRIAIPDCAALHPGYGIAR